MSFRRSIFWLHLIAGLISGILVAIMSVTGIAIAFEEEILAWVDADISSHSHETDSAHLTIAELLQIAQSEHPDFPIDYLRIPSDPNTNYEALAHREGPLYINPHTGATSFTQTEPAHHLIHTLEEWHRWLGMQGDWYPFGRLVMGIANLLFVFLCVSGLYLWWPRKWNWRQLKPRVLLKLKAKAKARDFNWHNVFGFWSLPLILLLAGTAVVISFRWGHNLPFWLHGETPPESRNFGMMYVEPAKVPQPAENAQRLPLDAHIPTIDTAYPDWEWIGIALPENETPESAISSLKVALTLPDHMPSRAYLPIELDPYSGEILQATHFNDRSRGLRTRVWIRFLHTGGAFGFTGKVIACIGCVAALILVYTGFALSWRRFIKR